MTTLRKRWWVSRVVISLVLLLAAVVGVSRYEHVTPDVPRLVLLSGSGCSRSSACST